MAGSGYTSPSLEAVGDSQVRPDGIPAAAPVVVIVAAVWDGAAAWNYALAVNVAVAVNVATKTNAING